MDDNKKNKRYKQHLVNHAMNADKILHDNKGDNVTLQYLKGPWITL